MGGEGVGEEGGRQPTVRPNSLQRHPAICSPKGPGRGLKGGEGGILYFIPRLHCRCVVRTDLIRPRALAAAGHARMEGRRPDWGPPPPPLCHARRTIWCIEGSLRCFAVCSHSFHLTRPLRDAVSYGVGSSFVMWVSERCVHVARRSARMVGRGTALVGASRPRSVRLGSGVEWCTVGVRALTV